MRLRWDVRALRDIDAIHRHITREDPAAARRVVDRIRKSVERLSAFPYSARPGVVAGTRLLAVPGVPYIVVHRVREETVDILAVIHTARRRRS
jgi:toxin ParE1/3/4